VIDERAIGAGQAQGLVRQRRQIGIVDLDGDLDRGARDPALAIKHRAERCDRGRGEAERGHRPAERRDRAFLGPALARERAAEGGVTEAGQEVTAQRGQIAREGGVCARCQHRAIERDGDPDLASRASREGEDHGASDAGMGGRLDWWFGPAVVDRVDDAIHLLHLHTRQRLEQRWNPGAVAEDHRDEHLALLDSLVKERRDLVAHPAPLASRSTPLIPTTQSTCASSASAGASP
jgi:hypothetical protein